MAARTSGSIVRAAQDGERAPRVDERAHADRLVDVGADAQADPAGAATGGGAGAAAAASPTRSSGKRERRLEVRPCGTARGERFLHSSWLVLLGSRVEWADYIDLRSARAGTRFVPGCDRVHSDVGGRGETIAPRRPVAREGAIMPADYKLRLGDGTILAVDEGGLRTWLIDGKAMVQPAGSRRWIPLREALAQVQAQATAEARREASRPRPAPEPEPAPAPPPPPVTPPAAAPAPKPPPPAPPEPEPELELTQSQPLALALEELEPSEPAPPPARRHPSRSHRPPNHSLRHRRSRRRPSRRPRPGRRLRHRSRPHRSRRPRRRPRRPSPDCCRPREARRARPARRAAGSRRSGADGVRRAGPRNDEGPQATDRGRPSPDGAASGRPSHHRFQAPDEAALRERAKATMHEVGRTSSSWRSCPPSSIPPKTRSRGPPGRVRTCS